MAANTINLWHASEADLKSLDGIGQARANSILQLRERKKDFNFYDVAGSMEQSGYCVYKETQGGFFGESTFAVDKQYTVHHRA
uniref:Uncharacterized protein n=1 Tax=Magallana gigas TaxID=29159 RepID=K1PJA9_MAGGI